VDDMGLLTLNAFQRAAIAEVIDKLEVYKRVTNIPGYYREREVVNKTHLVTHLADIFSIGDPTFHREAFYDACGLGEEERYLG